MGLRDILRYKGFYEVRDPRLRWMQFEQAAAGDPWWESLDEQGKYDVAQQALYGDFNPIEGPEEVPWYQKLADFALPAESWQEKALGHYVTQAGRANAQLLTAVPETLGSLPAAAYQAATGEQHPTLEMIREKASYPQRKMEELAAPYGRYESDWADLLGQLGAGALLAGGAGGLSRLAGGALPFTAGFPGVAPIMGTEMALTQAGLPRLASQAIAFAGLPAAQAFSQGATPWETLKTLASGGAMLGMFRGAEAAGLPMLVRSPAIGAGAGALTYAETGDPAEAIKSGITMTALDLASQPGARTLEALARARRSGQRIRMSPEEAWELIQEARATDPKLAEALEEAIDIGGPRPAWWDEKPVVEQPPPERVYEAETTGVEPGRPVRPAAPPTVPTEATLEPDLQAGEPQRRLPAPKTGQTDIGDIPTVPESPRPTAVDPTRPVAEWPDWQVQEAFQKATDLGNSPRAPIATRVESQAQAKALQAELDRRAGKPVTPPPTPTELPPVDRRPPGPPTPPPPPAAPEGGLPFGPSEARTEPAPPAAPEPVVEPPVAPAPPPVAPAAPAAPQAPQEGFRRQRISPKMAEVIRAAVPEDALAELGVRITGEGSETHLEGDWRGLDRLTDAVRGTFQPKPKAPRENQKTARAQEQNQGPFEYFKAHPFYLPRYGDPQHPVVKSHGASIVGTRKGQVVEDLDVPGLRRFAVPKHKQAMQWGDAVQHGIDAGWWANEAEAIQVLEKAQPYSPRQEEAKLNAEAAKLQREFDAAQGLPEATPERVRLAGQLEKLVRGVSPKRGGREPNVGDLVRAPGKGGPQLVVEKADDGTLTLENPRAKGPEAEASRTQAKASEVETLGQAAEEDMAYSLGGPEKGAAKEAPREEKEPARPVAAAPEAPTEGTQPRPTAAPRRPTRAELLVQLHRTMPGVFTDATFNREGELVLTARGGKKITWIPTDRIEVSEKTKQQFLEEHPELRDATPEELEALGITIRQVDGSILVKLTDRGLRTRGQTLVHETLHVARMLKLVTPAEYEVLRRRYAKDVKRENFNTKLKYEYAVEERIAEGLEGQRGDPYKGTLLEKFVDRLRETGAWAQRLGVKTGFYSGVEMPVFDELVRKARTGQFLERGGETTTGEATSAPSLRPDKGRGEEWVGKPVDDRRGLRSIPPPREGLDARKIGDMDWEITFPNGDKREIFGFSDKAQVLEHAERALQTWEREFGVDYFSPGYKGGKPVEQPSLRKKGDESKWLPGMKPEGKAEQEALFGAEEAQFEPVAKPTAPEAPPSSRIVKQEKLFEGEEKEAARDEVEAKRRREEEKTGQQRLLSMRGKEETAETVTREEAKAERKLERGIRSSAAEAFTKRFMNKTPDELYEEAREAQRKFSLRTLSEKELKKITKTIKEDGPAAVTFWDFLAAKSKFVPAIKLDGRIFEGPPGGMHAHAYIEAEKVLGEEMIGKVTDFEDGFVDRTTGKFMTRSEAAAARGESESIEGRFSRLADYVRDLRMRMVGGSEVDPKHVLSALGGVGNGLSQELMEQEAPLRELSDRFDNAYAGTKLDVGPFKAIPFHAHTISKDLLARYKREMLDYVKGLREPGAERPEPTATEKAVATDLSTETLRRGWELQQDADRKAAGQPTRRQQLEELMGPETPGVEPSPEEAFGAEPVKKEKPSLRPKDMAEAAWEDLREKVNAVTGGARQIFSDFSHVLAPTAGSKRDVLDVAHRMLGERYQSEFMIDAAIDSARRKMEKLSTKEKHEIIDELESGKLNADKEIAEFQKFARQTLDALRDAAKAYKPDWEAAIENYFPHIWKVLPGSGVQKKGWIGQQPRRPLEGSERWAKKRSFETVAEGLRQGGQLLSDNPADILTAHAGDIMKFISANRMFEAMKQAGMTRLVRRGRKAPDGWVRIDDKISRFTAGGPAWGEYYFQPDAGRMLKNYLSRDLIRESAMGKGIMGLKNLTTQVELGFSGFHAMFEALELMGSRIATGFRKMANVKDFWGGVRDIATFPAAPFAEYKAGKAFIKYAANRSEFLNTDEGQWFIKTFPEADILVEDLFRGGGKLKMHEDYRSGWRGSFRKAIADGNYIGALPRSAMAALEGFTAPLFEKLIPRWKVGMWAREYQLALREKAGALARGETTRGEVARKTWSFIEDRLGEMNFDNLWWDRTFKSALQMMFRSVTWKLGNLRAFGKTLPGEAKALRDYAKNRDNPTLDQNLAWLMGMSVITSAIGYTVTKLFTGEDPKDIKDIVFPRIDPEDPTQRISTPTYWKDVVHLSHGPWPYVRSSLSGFIGKLAEDWNNQDFYGTQIADPDDPLPKRMWDYTQNVFPIPISFQSFARLKEEGKGGVAWSSFAGLTKAPGYVSLTPAQRMMREMLSEKQAKGGRTKEEAEKREQVYDAIQELRAGRTPQKPEMLTETEWRKLLKTTQQDPDINRFKRLTLREASRVWNEMSDEERKRVGKVFLTKLNNRAMSGAPSSELKQLQKAYRAVAGNHDVVWN